MSNRPKFGKNFTPRAKINSEASTTKSIAFGGLNEEEKESLKNKLTSGISTNQSKDVVDISEFIPSDYVIKKISRDKLKPAPDTWNFFAKPSKDKLILLAESIHDNGLLQPIIVREMDDKGQYYQILAGHTRNEAYGILYDVLNDPKYLNIEAIVFPYGSVTDDKAQDIVCDTNFMQRGNLSTRDTAKCIYLKAKKYRQNKVHGTGSVADRIAKEYKMKRSSVFFWQRLADLTDDLQDFVDSHNITLANAYKLAFLPKDSQTELLSKVSIYLNNDSLKRVKAGDSLESIIKNVEDNYGIRIKSLRYEISEDELNNIKDEPILLYVSKDKKEEVLKALNNIDGAYVIRS